MKFLIYCSSDYPEFPKPCEKAQFVMDYTDEYGTVQKLWSIEISTMGELMSLVSLVGSQKDSKRFHGVIVTELSPEFKEIEALKDFSGEIEIYDDYRE